MHLVCNGKDLSTAVSAVTKVVNSHSTVALLHNVLLSAHDSTLHIRATDLSTSLERVIPVEVREGGAATVPGKLFASYLSNASNHLLEISATPTRLSIRSADGAKYDFNALPAEDYPPLPEHAMTSEIELDGEILRRAIRSVTFAAARDEARGALIGTRLSLSESGLSLAATDGYVLATWEGGTRFPESAAWNVIVPTSALHEAARNIDTQAKVRLCRLGANQNWIRFTGDGLNVTARTLDGQYPRTDNLFPTHFEAQIIVDRILLRQALKRAELVCDDRSPKVLLAGSDGKLTISANSERFGTAFEQVSTQQDGDDFSVSLNATYIGAVVDRIEGDEVALRHSGALRPLLVTGVGDRVEAKYLVMPIR